MKKKIIWYSVATLLLVVALNAFGGGYYGLSGAKEIPREWLDGSPFKSYFIPALFLFVVIGGSCLVTAVAMFRRAIWALKASVICSLIILSWLLAQVVIIGYVSWMQPATAITAIVILLLGLLYSRLP